MGRQQAVIRYRKGEFVTDCPVVPLNNGTLIPQLGFGVFQVPPDEAQRCVSRALDVGYRHLDTAAMYQNEKGVGAAIAASGVAREDIFVTTKLNNDAHGYDSALAACATSLANLGLEYVDLYLIHWPLPARDRYLDTWRAFEKLHAEGMARAIGVSNFTIPHLQRLATDSQTVPAVNQVELHPYLVQQELRNYDAQHRIVTQAWSPIARGGDLLQDPAITALASKYGKTPAQVVLRWHLDLGNVVFPKSVTPARIAENFDVFDFSLEQPDLAAITALNRDERIGPDPDTFDGG